MHGNSARLFQLALLQLLAEVVGPGDVLAVGHLPDSGERYLSKLNPE